MFSERRESLGDEEQAVRYFSIAAGRLASGSQFLAAGDLMRVKAQRRQEAHDWYRAGWLAGCAEAVTCAERLLDEYLVTDNRDAFEALLTEAETALAARPREAGRLFNYAIRVSEDFLTPEARSDLTDRIRLVFAMHLRAATRAGESVALASDLFGVDHPWPPPVGRDATVAVRNRSSGVSPGEATPPVPVRVATGPVTAVAVVRATFDVLLAIPSGVVRWNVSQGRSVPVSTHWERVNSLAASRGGEIVYALSREGNGTWQLRCFVADGAEAYRSMGQYSWPAGSDDTTAYLQPVAPFRGGRHQVAVLTPVEHRSFAGPFLQPDEADTFSDDKWPVRLLAETSDGHAWYWAGETVWCRRPGDVPMLSGRAAFTPATTVDWLSTSSGVLEVAAVDAGGRLHWAEFDGHGLVRPRHRSTPPSLRTRYTATCLVSPGVLAAVTSDGELHWLRAAGSELAVSGSALIGVPDRIIAVVPRPDPNEVVVVLASGEAIDLRRS